MTNLQQLRHFAALVEHGNFARAAEAVHLSQPALSRSIQALEASLDCRLLDRRSRGISLTVHGHLVLEHAQRLLAGSQALKNAVSQLANLESGELLLGSGPYPAARLVPQALGRMVSKWPRVRVNLIIDNWLGLRERLLRDELELFVADVRDLEEDSLLHVEPLGTHAGVMFCRPGHPLTGRTGLSIKDLLEFPLATTQLPDQIERELKQIAEREHPASIQCDNFMVLKVLVAQSNAISMAFRDVLADDIDAGRLAVLPMEQDTFSQHSAYGLVSRTGHTLSPAAQAMRLQILGDAER